VEKYGSPAPAPKIHVTLGPTRDVRLGDLGHGDRRLHAGGGSGLLEEVLQGEGVHDGAEHPHVVRASAVHSPLTELGTPEEVPSPDHHGDLDPVDRLGDLARDLTDDIGVDPELSAAEGLS